MRIRLLFEVLWQAVTPVMYRTGRQCLIMESYWVYDNLRPSWWLVDAI